MPVAEGTLLEIPVPALAEELALIPVFSRLSPAQLTWLASRMTVRQFEAGDLVSEQGSPADRMVVVLEGELKADFDNADARVFVARAGQVTGMLPFSRLKTYPASSWAILRSRLALFPAAKFPDMLQEIPDLGPALVGIMSDRIREATKAETQRDKLMALGKLSAGLAHELNNPASAAARASENLKCAIAELREANRNLDQLALTADQRALIAELEANTTCDVAPADALEQSDREEALETLLRGKGVKDAWQLAPSLVAACLPFDRLQQVVTAFPVESLQFVIARISSSANITHLVDEIASSTARISELVRSIKEYSYMDRMPEQQVDVHKGIENTLIMLRHRLKQGIEVVRDYDRTLPPVCARGNELNQVWTNLIDNAADAMNGKGKLIIKTSKDLGQVLVEVRDTGAGIPQEARDHIFEPFFTTKGVGAGTGLGLETVFNIVTNYGGKVTFESRPGDTRFQVRLPAAPETCPTPKPA